MLKVILTMILFLSFSPLSFSQEKETKEEVASSDLKEIVGIVEEISEDGSFLIIDRQKVLTTQEFLDESFIEVGDRIKVFGEESPQGLKIVDYEYLYVPPGESTSKR